MPHSNSHISLISFRMGTVITTGLNSNSSSKTLALTKTSSNWDNQTSNSLWSLRKEPAVCPLLRTMRPNERSHLMTKLMVMGAMALVRSNHPTTSAYLTVMPTRTTSNSSSRSRHPTCQHLTPTTSEVVSHSPSSRRDNQT